MTNREAMEIVLKLAEQTHAPDIDVEEADAGDAIYQMQDYMNDLMRLEEK
jgi:predicted aconitase